MSNVYQYTTKIRDKSVKFRKWKVKDKKKFQANKDNPVAFKEALVYDCLEDEKIALSEEEYRYMLMIIRDATLKDRITYTFNCENCEEDYDYEANLVEIMKPEFEPYGDIIVNDRIFTMGELRNRGHYEEVMAAFIGEEEQKDLIDFILHVHAYNDNDGLDFEEIFNIVNDLDIDEFEYIFVEWNKMKFKMDNVQEVVCPHCGNKELFEFDALPDFFPESWGV